MYIQTISNMRIKFLRIKLRYQKPTHARRSIFILFFIIHILFQELYVYKYIFFFVIQLTKWKGKMQNEINEVKKMRKRKNEIGVLCTFGVVKKYLSRFCRRENGTTFPVRFRQDLSSRYVFLPSYTTPSTTPYHYTYMHRYIYIYTHSSLRGFINYKILLTCTVRNFFKRMEQSMLKFIVKISCLSQWVIRVYYQIYIFISGWASKKGSS